MAEELALGEVQVSQRFGALVAKSVEVIAIADETYMLPRDPETGGLVRPPNMPEPEWNIHCDAMKSARNAPLYMVEHMERVKLAQKIHGMKGVASPAIAQAVVQVFVQKKYEDVDVTVKG